MKDHFLFRTLTVLLAAVLLVSCCPALAEDAASDADDYVPQRYEGNDLPGGSYKLEFGNSILEYEVRVSNGAVQQVEVELEDVDGKEYEVGFDAGGKIIRAEYETGDGQIFYDGSVWKDKSGAEVEGPDLSFVKKYFDAYMRNRGAYPHNTMSLSGISLRDYYPGMTDKWYHVVPVDLTQEGVFRYETLVSNMYYLGYCEVTVRDGTVTTDYFLPYGNVEPEQQCVAWFTSLDEITPAFLENPKSSFRFGKPVSIQDDLKGKDVALLFICNRISYKVPYKLTNGFPRRYFEGTEAVRTYRNGLEKLMFKLREN